MANSKQQLDADCKVTCFDAAWQTLAFVDEPVASGVIRTVCEDFRVQEIMGFEPSGEGEHDWLYIEKVDTNTQDVAREIAKHSGVRVADIGFSGMKDKRAVTTQWFSVAAKVPIDWTKLDGTKIGNSQCRVIRAMKHERKLRRGTHRSNQFTIVLREISGDEAIIERTLRRIGAEGVPNYFGPQRFGRAGKNLSNARRMFAGDLKLRRDSRGMVLSAARSWLFNQVLSERIKAGNWNRALIGDAMQLVGSQSFFIADQVDSELERRVREFDVHPAGPLVGKGEPVTQSDALAIETKILEQEPELVAGLCSVGMKPMRRAFRLMVGDLSWQWLDGALELRFILQSGAFATSVLREIARC